MQGIGDCTVRAEALAVTKMATTRGSEALDVILVLTR